MAVNNNDSTSTEGFNLHDLFKGGRRPRKYKPKGSWVYFVADTAARVKIGFSKTPLHRLQQIQQGTGMACRILGVLPGGRDVEEKIHTQFEHLRTRGEWFKDDASTHDFIAKKCQPPSVLIEAQTPQRMRELLVTNNAVVTRLNSTLVELTALIAANNQMVRSITELMDAATGTQHNGDRPATDLRDGTP